MQLSSDLNTDLGIALESGRMVSRILGRDAELYGSGQAIDFVVPSGNGLWFCAVCRAFPGRVRFKH